MSVPFKIGVLQLSMRPLEETVHMAQACDAAGVDTFWLAEAMLAGDEVKYEGKAFQAFAPALKSDSHAPRWRVRIYVGATGPVLQRLAGSHSDGLLTASITTPKFVQYSRKMMEEGARKAGKDPANLDLGSVIVGSVGEDPKSARQRAPEMAGMSLANTVH